MPLFLISILLLASLGSSTALAQRLPLWELGGALGAAQLPYYRGSSQSRNVVLPIPLAQYRGKKYSLDKEGAHRWFYKSRYFKINLSLAAGLPVPNDGQVKAREGMPALDGVLEVGPVVDINLWRYKRHSFSLHLPLRMATSVDWLSANYRGVQFTPFFHYLLRGYGAHPWQLNFSIGPQFATQDYHAYYYSVPARFANAERSAYTASSGYSGSRATLHLNKRHNKWWFSLFVRYDHLRQATFAASPLLERQDSLIGGMVIGWIFMESPKEVHLKQRDTY